MQGRKRTRGGQAPATSVVQPCAWTSSSLAAAASSSTGTVAATSAGSSSSCSAVASTLALNVPTHQGYYEEAPCVSRQQPQQPEPVTPGLSALLQGTYTYYPGTHLPVQGWFQGCRWAALSSRRREGLFVGRGLRSTARELLRTAGSVSWSLARSRGRAVRPRTAGAEVTGAERENRDQRSPALSGGLRTINRRLACLLASPGRRLRRGCRRRTAFAIRNRTHDDVPACRK